MQLKDKVAVVTGAGSERGIGRAIALNLAKEGSNVVVVDINSEGIQKVAQEVENIGTQALAVKVDVTQPEEVFQMAKKIIQRFGKIDILVNNAGITQSKTLVDMSIEDWDRIIDVNLKGTFLCTKAVLPQMIEQREGKIVCISSVSAKRGGGIFGGVHYSSAKAGVLGFVKALAREVAQYNINVNAVAPGLVDTDITGGRMTPERKKEVVSLIPKGRIASPEEIAKAVVFLLSDWASYITGATLDVNGGLYMD